VTRADAKATWGFWVAAASLVAFQAVLPADASWINDEPVLIYKALAANHAGRLETVGLMGSVGLPYGPHTTWIYQLALVFTRDLVVLVAVKSLLTAAIVLLCLLEVGRAAGLRRAFALLALLSPFLFFYGRVLWDNVFLVPFTALLFAAAARSFRRPSGVSWSVGVASCYFLFHIHLMSLFVVLPTVLVMPFACRAWLRRNWALALAPVVAALVASYPYVSILLGREFSAGRPPELWQRFASSFSGLRFYSAAGFFEYFAPDYALSAASGAIGLQVLKWIGLLSLPLYAAGVVLCGVALWHALVRRAFVSRDWMDLLMLACTSTTVVFYLWVGIGDQHPHHMNSMWLPTFYFLWRAASTYWDRPWMPVMTGVYASALALLLLVFVGHIHRNTGNRARHYGPTLGNQIQVARQIADAGAARPFEFRAREYGRYKHRLHVLLALMRALPEATDAPATHAIEYVDPESRDGRIRVVAVAAPRQP
jgi:hypothetical protein